MLYDAQQIERACAGDISDPVYFKQIYDKLVRSQEADQPIPIDYPDMFRSFLKSLPSAKLQRKIRNRLKTMAQTSNPSAPMDLHSFRWWDLRGECALLAMATYRVQRFPISFFWKPSPQSGHKKRCADCRARQEMRLHQVATSIVWLPDPDPNNGYGLRIEAPTYQAMKMAFHGWLLAPSQHETQA